MSNPLRPREGYVLDTRPVLVMACVYALLWLAVAATIILIGG